jgi:hypothetical protein
MDTGAVSWEDNLEGALSKAQRERKYLLLYFHKPN